MGRPPRDEEAGVTLAMKVKPAAKQWVVDAAKIRGESVSDTMRAMFTFAVRNMPARWRPDDETGSTESGGTDAAPIAKLIQDRPSMAQGRELRNVRNKT